MIFSFLDPVNLLKGMSVCRNWRLIGSSDLLWKKFYFDKLSEREEVSTLSYYSRYRALIHQQISLRNRVDEEIGLSSNNNIRSPSAQVVILGSRKVGKTTYWKSLKRDKVIQNAITFKSTQYSPNNSCINFWVWDPPPQLLYQNFFLFLLLNPAGHLS